jgi:hypothetical protein
VRIFNVFFFDGCCFDRCCFDRCCFFDRVDQLISCSPAVVLDAPIPDVSGRHIDRKSGIVLIREFMRATSNAAARNSRGGPWKQRRGRELTCLSIVIIADDVVLIE